MKGLELVVMSLLSCGHTACVPVPHFEHLHLHSAGSNFHISSDIATMKIHTDVTSGESILIVANVSII